VLTVTLGVVSAAQFLQMMHTDCIQTLRMMTLARGHSDGERMALLVFPMPMVCRISHSPSGTRKSMWVYPLTRYHANGWQRLSERTTVRLVESRRKPWREYQRSSFSFGQRPHGMSIMFMRCTPPLMVLALIHEIPLQIPSKAISI